MTVTTTTNKATYSGDGATKAFPYPFKIFLNTDLQVYLSGVLKTLTTDYTVDNVGNPAGGNVNFVVAPPVGTANVVIIRTEPLTQTTSYPLNDKFAASAHEAALDKLTMIAQQLNALLGSQLAFASTSTFSNPLLDDPVIGQYLYWKATSPPEVGSTALTGSGLLPDPVTVPHGGTGLATLTAHSVLLGEGAAALAALALTKGQLLVGQTGADPVALAISTDGLALLLDSTQAAGVKWANPVPTNGYRVSGLIGVNNSGTPNTKFDLSADQVIATVPGTTLGYVKRFTGVITNDNTSQGVNGRDQAGALATAAFVHLYFTTDGAGTWATLASQSAPSVGPTLQGGHIAWAYAGAVWNAAGPAYDKVYFRGSKCKNQTPKNVLSAGAATVETAISLSSAIPANALAVQLHFDLLFTTAGQASDTLTTRLVTGVAWEAYVVTNPNGAAGTTHLFDHPELPNVSQQFYYLWSGANGQFTVDVAGYTMPNGGE